MYYRRRRKIHSKIPEGMEVDSTGIMEIGKVYQVENGMYFKITHREDEKILIESVNLENKRKFAPEEISMPEKEFIKLFAPIYEIGNEE